MFWGFGEGWKAISSRGVRMFLVIIHVDRQTIIQSRESRKSCLRLVDAYRFVSSEKIRGYIYQGGKYEEVQ